MTHSPVFQWCITGGHKNTSENKILQIKPKHCTQKHRSNLGGLDITSYCLILSRQPADNLDTIGTAVAHLRLTKIVGIVINLRLLSVLWGVASVGSRVRTRSGTVLHWTFNMGIVEHPSPRLHSPSAF